MKFLHEQLLQEFGRQTIRNTEMPDFLVWNLNPDFELREYQKEAFARFFHYLNSDFEGKQELPYHLLFNMATGSGKTLIMAGLILYLYNEGYRNFLFFVGSKNIIKKTKDNFLNTGSSKYLFDKEITIDNKKVSINEVNNFEDADPNGINIVFTTTQKLHGDLTIDKENSITFEDFKNQKIVLLSDEAHHVQATTRQNALSLELEKPTWENTIEKIFSQNKKNLLLEFTATMDWMNREILEKYKDKVIYRYDLKEFRNAGYSKDPVLFHTDTDRRTRMLQAIVISQYRQEVATKYGLPMKPIVLFKAQRTIADSQENKKMFHEMIEGLSVDDLKEVANKTDFLQKIFKFFKDQKLTNSLLIKKLKNSFAENKCLDVNNDSDIVENQILLNSLEDKDNHIRAIFAVQKLNEGWDVLNLFDIVRLYESRDGKNNNPGKTTIAEAQLIGRGARYNPFIVDGYDEKYKRKFDNSLNHELRILEELHYHSHNENRYISEITKALVKQGMMDENVKEVEIKLKEEFKNKRFYKSGIVWRNEKIKTDFSKKKVLQDLPSRKQNIVFHLSSGKGDESSVFGNDKQILKQQIANTKKDFKISDIESHVILNAMQKSDFYDFVNLQHYFPELKSQDDFVSGIKYLGGFEITIEGTDSDIENMRNYHLYEAILKLLNTIENEITTGVAEFQGTEEFVPASFGSVFSDKKIKVKVGSEQEKGKMDYLADKDWYVFDALHGTGEEQAFVELVERMIVDLKEKYQEIYLVRNERVLKIYNFDDGKAFEPDYLLFMNDKNKKSLTYQLFIEPKGNHLVDHDKWKDEFLKEITKRNKKGKIFKYSNRKYKILGVPFYNKHNENDFKENLLGTLD